MATAIGVLGVIAMLAFLTGTMIWAVIAEETAQVNYNDWLMERKADEHRTNERKAKAIQVTNRWIETRRKA